MAGTIDVSVQRAGKDPLMQCDFIVEIDGLTVAGFMEYSENQKSKGKSTYREGNMANRVHKQNGLETIADVTLKRGIFAGENVLYDWYMSGVRKTIDIVALKHGRDGDRRVKTTTLYDVLPNDYKGGKGDAMSEDGNQIAEIVICVEDWDEV